MKDFILSKRILPFSIFNVVATIAVVAFKIATTRVATTSISLKKAVRNCFSDRFWGNNMLRLTRLKTQSIASLPMTMYF